MNNNNMNDYEAAAAATTNEIFKSLHQGIDDEYNEGAEIILETVRDNCSGFQADIAEKALEGSKLSDKQRWCVAFAFDKVRDFCCEMDCSAMGF